MVPGGVTALSPPSCSAESGFLHGTHICRWCQRCPGKAQGPRGGQGEGPTTTAAAIHGEHPSVCRELGMLRDTRAIGGQHDVRDGDWRELAPPHSSPLIRTTLGQHKFFHVHLQHLFIILTKPQDITAQELPRVSDREGFHQQQFPGRGERVLWFGLWMTAQESRLSPDATVAPAVLHGPRPRRGDAALVSAGSGHTGESRAASPGHCRATATACPARAQPQLGAP